MRLLLALFREVPKWDRPSQIALILAVILLIIDLSILSSQPDLQTPALIGAVGLILGIQGIFMWGNRNLVTDITAAQRQMIAGEFDAAIQTLSTYIDNAEHPQLDALILLGNAYRSVGNLQESELWLQQALERRSDNSFALYNLGKTALAQGDYQFAVDHLKESLIQGATDVANFDIALAYFLMNDHRQAVSHLDKKTTFDEVYRELFSAYIRRSTHADNEIGLNQQGLPFWEAEVERFQHTPYGQAIAHHVEQIKKML